MYTRLLLCQKEEGTLVIARCPAFSTQVHSCSEVIIQNPHDHNFKHRCKVLAAMDCEIDNEEYKFVLASHVITTDDLYDVIYTVHYVEVPLPSNMSD